MDLLTLNLIYDCTGVIFAFIAACVVYYQWVFRYWKTRGVPYVEPRIPWGSLQSHYRPAMSMAQEFGEIYKAAKKKGYKHIGVFAATSPIYIPVDKDVIRCILSRDFNYFTDKGIYINEKDEPIGAHLFSLGGTRWKTLRKTFSPTFTSSKLKSMIPIITACGITLENYLNDNVNLNEPVDIKQLLSSYTTDIIGNCAFGINCNSFVDSNPFRDMAGKLVTRTVMADVKFAIIVNFPEIAQLFGMTWIPKSVTKFFTKVVEDAVDYREKNQVNRKDFLQCLIDIKNNSQNGEYGFDTKITMSEIVGQSFVFFVAGYETSSTAMSFALYELAANPDIQDKVREEIDAVLEKYDDKITYDALNEMKYLGQCIDEALRKYPPNPFLTRACVEDYKVPGTDAIIEKGTRVIIPTRGVHFDEEYYQNSEVFDPERFSEKNKKNIDPYTYLPFGEGPRVCIGLRFGILQMKVGIATFLKNFKLSVSKKMVTPLKLTVAFVPTAEGGLWLDLEKI